MYAGDFGGYCKSILDFRIDEAVTLIETTGTYSDTITLPDGGNYIGIECEDFNKSIESNIE